MRIAIITTDSFISYLLISDLVARQPHAIAAIVITPSRAKGRGTLGTIRYVAAKSGLAYLFSKVLLSVWVLLAEWCHKLGLLRHCITPTNLAESFGIETFRSADCNGEQTLDYLRGKDIDVLLSINVYQRMGEPLLSLPKITAINNHFGLLPRYKGMAPYTWAMAKGEKEIGLSVHHMVLEFDEGKLIRQERLPLGPGDSTIGVCYRGCLVARKMICEAVDAVEADPQAGFDQVGPGSYYSMPTRQCIAGLTRRGFALLHLVDLLDVLRDTLYGRPLP